MEGKSNDSRQRPNDARPSGWPGVTTDHHHDGFRLHMELINKHIINNNP
jgi:hypothetical protein